MTSGAHHYLPTEPKGIEYLIDLALCVRFTNTVPPETRNRPAQRMKGEEA